MENPQTLEIQNLINNAHSILVATHRTPSLDSLAASLAVYLALLRLGKDVTIACPTEPIVEQSELVAIDQIKTKLIGKNVLISIEDYSDGSIEKVSYTENSGKFNLVIQPAENSDINLDKIKIMPQGAKFDLIITVDTIDLQYLDNIYTQEQKIYSEAKIINIDRHQNNNNYGTINLVLPNASSVSEIVAEFLQNLNISPDADIATNILIGIQAATKNFQIPTTTASAFEITGACLRIGAKRSQKIFSSRLAETPQTNTPPVNQNITQKEPPEDWLQPKIYRSSTPI